MSRRRTPPATDFEEFREVRVGCTDRGTHPFRLLATVTDRKRVKRQRLPVGDRVVPVRGRWGVTGRYKRERQTIETSQIVDAGRRGTAGGGRTEETVRTFRPEDGGKIWVFSCPSCGRDTQLRDERLGAVLDALYGEPAPVRDAEERRHARHVFDVSRLPC